MEGSSDVFVIRMRQSNTCFMNVFMQNLFGVYHKLLLILHHRTMLVTCLVHGYISLEKS
jgi:ubiquitin C-terminal hydrolase